MSTSSAIPAFRQQSGPAQQSNNQNTAQQGQGAPQSQGAGNAATNAGAPKGLTLIERAARTLGTAFEDESRYPALDNYISRT